MKAAQFHGARNIRISTVQLPPLQPGQVLVEVEWCGICGSDLHEYLKGPLVIPPADRPHKATGESLPVTLGHEFCGRVGEVTNGTRLKVGQAVMVDPRLFCKTCLQCRSLKTNMCQQWGFLGLSGNGGGLSERVIVDEEACHILPDSVDLRYVALIEPLTVARHALRSSGVASFDCLSVLILGAGPVGLAVAMDLQGRGTKQVIVSELSTTRQSQIAKHCDVALDPSKVHIPDECRNMTAGAGVDLVFDCAGVMPALRVGFDALKNQGTYVNVAGWETEPIIPMELFHMKELIFRSSMTYNEQDFAGVVADFISGKFSGIEEMVTARIALADVVHHGFEALVTNKEDHIKILVTPKPDLLLRS